MTTKTFKRYELKYFVTPSQYQQLREALLAQMNYDPFCKDGQNYMIYNLYFDTPDDAVIRRSLEKPYYKEKLRLRSYKMPTREDDLVFLELKKKIGGIVAKRRAVLHYTQALELVEQGILPPCENYQDQQVMHEILDFVERYPVFPKLYLSYERVAFFGKDDPELRVSFDRNILTRREQVNLSDGDYGNELLQDGGYLMEVKCAGAVPLWLSRLLAGMQIYKTSFSKYGAEYKQHVSGTRTHQVA